MYHDSALSVYDLSLKEIKELPQSDHSVLEGGSLHIEEIAMALHTEIHPYSVLLPS